MLKLPPLGRGRHRFGLMSLAGLALLATGAVQALNADNKPAAAPDVELKMELSYQVGDASNRKTLTSKPTLRVAMGQRAMVMLNGSPGEPTLEQIAIDIEALDLGGGKIELRTEIKKGNPLTTVSKPRLVTLNGVKALIEQGREDPNGAEHLSLAITPTVLADAKP